ncbi:MAG TPA: FecR family protein [Dehalococcoidia bacterium]|nr:FecR family protein [Dehalococcoidia bacterium]
MRLRRRVLSVLGLGPLFFVASILLPLGAALYLIFFAEAPVPITSAILSTVNNVVEVQGVNETDFRRAEEQQVLVSGDGVRTSKEGRGVITFVDESSIVLEPDSQLRILPPARRGGGLINRFSQSFGTSWSQLSALAGGSYEINTPAGVISVREGAILRVGVGRTEEGRAAVQVVVLEGEAEVRSSAGDGRSVVVGAGETVRAVEGEGVADPEAFVPDNEIVLRLFSPFFMLVAEPASGLSTGLLPPGIALRQIPLSATTAGGVDPQTVRLNEVRPGTYTIYLLPKRQGGFFTVTADGRSLQGPIFADARDGETEGCEWLYLLLTVDLDAEGLLSFGELQGPFPLTRMPGVIGREIDSDCPPPRPIAQVAAAQATPTPPPTAVPPTPVPTQPPPPTEVPEEPTQVPTAAPSPTARATSEPEFPEPTMAPTVAPTPPPRPDIGITPIEESVAGSFDPGLPLLLAMAPGVGYAIVAALRRRGVRR